MSKLIYSPTSTLLEGTYDGVKNADQARNPVYHSVAFTGDGFLYTHGKKFRLFNVIDDVVDGLLFQIERGVAGLYIDGTSIGTGTVVQTVTGDGVVTATTSAGAVTLGHASYLTAAQATTYGSATTIPIITVNQQGHITAISNSGTIDISKISASATTTQGVYHPVAVTDNTLQNPVYHANLSFDENGNLFANNYYIGANPLSSLFAPLSHTSVYATDQTYGHVTLMDTVDDTKDAASHIAATPKAVQAGINAANQYSEELFAAQDAMVFVGTINADGTITSHNTTILPTAIDNTTLMTGTEYKVGWTFRFVQAGTFSGQDVEVGDMIIAVRNKGNEFAISDWTIIQTNISGALTANSNLNGLLYANNSRVVNALALSSGILSYNGTNLSFINPNTTWRDIQVEGTSIGTNILNLVAGNAINITAVDGETTIAVNASSIIQTSAALAIEQGNVQFSYAPTAAATLTIGNGLTLSVANSAYTLQHAAGTAITRKLGSITTDSFGHVTSVEEVSKLPNPYKLTINGNSTQAIEYDGAAAKVLNFKDGTDFTFSVETETNGDKTIKGSVTHKYRGVQFFPTLDSQSATPLLANNVNTAFTLIGGTNVSLSNTAINGDSLPAGTLMISAEDTWRDIQVYKFQSNLLSRSSIGTSIFKLDDDFIMVGDEVGISWTEIDDEGRITYVK